MVCPGPLGQPFSPAGPAHTRRSSPFSAQPECAPSALVACHSCPSVLAKPSFCSEGTLWSAGCPLHRQQLLFGAQPVASGGSLQRKVGHLGV